jgi:two-component sensor histidine kinase
VLGDRPQRGFGTRLIERTVRQELNGDVRIEFARSGLACELRVPVAKTAGAAEEQRT